jgi:hypothetical protein
MTTGAAVQLGGTAPAQPALQAPANIVDGPNGGVMVDTKVTPPEPKKADAPAGDRPAWLPEGFKTPEDMAKAYTELRTKMSQDGAPKPPEGSKPAEKPADGTPSALDSASAVKAVTEAGLDMAKLEAEYAEKGTLSEDSLKALEGKGLSREQVNNYIKGQEARATQMRSEFAQIAGGEAKLSTVYEWAAANLDAKDVASYNGLIDSGNTDGAKLMLKGLLASYEAANGREPNLLSGDGSRSGRSVTPYGSNAEMVADMSSAKYQTDPAFRRAVQERLSVSTAMLR